MPDVQPSPDGYTAITPYLIVEGAAGFIDFLVSAFGAVERFRLDMPEGGIGHAEVEIDGAVLMLSDALPPEYPPTRTLIHLYVPDWRRRLRPGPGRRRHVRRRARQPVLRRPPRPHHRPQRQPLVHLHPQRRPNPRPGSRPPSRDGGGVGYYI